MTNCSLCNVRDDKVIYNGVIRDGVAGMHTKKTHKVVKCNGCGLVRLLNNPLSKEYYQSDEYRNAYNDTTEVDDYIQMHDNEQPPRLEKVGIDMFRNKTVLDFGCGGGSFLDLVGSLASKTIGIEPYNEYRDSLNNRGHQVFSDVETAKQEYKEAIDSITSFGVIEHVEDPFQYLKDGFDLLKRGGRMYLETNNLNEILMKLSIDSFDRFFYRTAHLWYFDENTLEKIAKKAGFSDVKVSFRHNFDMSNTMLWLRDSQPTGNGKLNFLNNRIDKPWVEFMESSGLADMVCVEMIK